MHSLLGNLLGNLLGDLLLWGGLLGNLLHGLLDDLLGGGLGDFLGDGFLWSSSGCKIKFRLVNSKTRVNLTKLGLKPSKRPR